MIKCRTKDGLELDLEASLQYRVDADSIFKIYTSYGTQEKAILTRVILDIISETSTKYTSNDFFTKRSEIQKKMKADLQQNVLDQTWHEVVFFQLRSLSLPDQYEKEIQNTEVKGQDILKSEKERAREEVKFNTNVAVARLAVNATLESAYGQGNKTVYEAEATAATVRDVIKNQAVAYAEMKTSNALDND